MPGLITGSRSSSEGPRANEQGSSRNSVVEDDYVATSFPGYAEKPLEEQLEPIAVVGMGKLNSAMEFGTRTWKE